MFHYHRYLSQEKNKCNRHHAKYFKAGPKIVAKSPPYEFVQNSQKYKEPRPADCQFPPTFVIEFNRGIEDVAEKRGLEKKSSKKNDPE